MPSPGCLILAAGAVLGGALFVRSDTWQRFSGGTVAEGTFELHSSGALIVRWSGQATLQRTSSFTRSADGYLLVLHAPRSGPDIGHTNEVDFSWPKRPRAGHYEIVLLTDTTQRVPGVIGGGFATESRTPIEFVADSGGMDVTDDHGTLHGHFGMRCAPRAARPSRDSAAAVRVFGTFSLRLGAVHD